MIGGWSFVDMPPVGLPEPVATVFGELLGGMKGATFVPVLYCGKQIVNGENHLIICKQTLITAGSPENIVKVIIHIGRDDHSILEIKNLL